MAKLDQDIDIVESVNYPITHPDAKHYLRVDAYYGCTHKTSFLNAEGKVVTISNENNDGYIGFGMELKGMTMKVRTKAFADIDELGTERIRLEYFIDDQKVATQVNKYDRPEDDNDAPLLKFSIVFK